MSRFRVSVEILYLFRLIYCMNLMWLIFTKLIFILLIYGVLGFWGFGVLGYYLDKFSVRCALSPQSVLLIEVLDKALKAPSIIVDENKPGVNY